MKRLALVLTVAALAAVSCTTPGAVPATTSSSSTTQAGASAREAVIPFDPSSHRPTIDSSLYPSGATIVAEWSIDSGCLWVGLQTSGGVSTELEGSRNCTSSVVGGEAVLRSNPVPLIPGEHRYVPALDEPAGFIPELKTVLRIRW